MKTTIGSIAFVVARAASLAIFLFTSVYAVAAYSPFAYDMFIKPQLLPWLATFAAWQHVWFAVAALLGIATIVTDLRNPDGDPWTVWIARSYAIAMAAAVVFLIANPVVATLSSNSRSLAVALLALIPPLWLSVIDHVRTRAFPVSATVPAPAFLTGALLAAILLSTTHVIIAIATGERLAVRSEWLILVAWSLALMVCVFMFAGAVRNAIAEVACATARPEGWRYALTLLAVAVLVAEVLRRMVLPTIAIDGADGSILSASIGSVVVAAFSGMSRRLSTMRSKERTEASSGARLAMVAVVTPLVAFGAQLAIARVASVDWNFTIQKFIVFGEWALVLTLCTRAMRAQPMRRATIAQLLVPPVASLSVVHGLSAAADRQTGQEAAASTHAVLQRHATRDASFKLAWELTVREPGFDSAYYTYLAHATDANASHRPLPSLDFAEASSKPRRTPDIYLFVIDSLRRDYLSAYNPRVDFTPGFATLARDSFVFHNAYTRYGGTLLAMPSIWAGGTVNRRWRAGGFERMNALEKLALRDGYRVVINDYTVADQLRHDLPVTVLDPQVPSVKTDLCHLLNSFEAHLDASRTDARPLFTFMAPMNVHILNTHGGSKGGAPHDSEFDEPYVARLKAIDQCFAAFISDLKARNRYDQSIIIVTSDHGDSLGERGRWGHQFSLTPEVMQVPMIVHIPEALRRSVTTDLARVTFSTDIAPTLYGLLGHDVRDLGPMFGSPLFTVPTGHLPDRRRESFLLMSSYGPAYAMLRRNGRFLYISDLVNRHEEAYDMAQTSGGVPLDITGDLRDANHRDILARVHAVNAFFDGH